MGREGAFITGSDILMDGRDGSVVLWPAGPHVKMRAP